MLSEAMTHLPGNDVFQSRAEIITLAKYLFGGGVLYYVTVVLFVLSLTSINVAAIIISSQTMDITLIKIKETCALEFFPHFGASACARARFVHGCTLARARQASIA